MKITLDGSPHYTLEDDIKTIPKLLIPDHEVWFRIDVEGQLPEFIIMRASHRITQENMEKIIKRLLT